MSIQNTLRRIRMHVTDFSAERETHFNAYKDVRHQWETKNSVAINSCFASITRPEEMKLEQCGLRLHWTGNRRAQFLVTFDNGKEPAIERRSRMNRTTRLRTIYSPHSIEHKRSVLISFLFSFEINYRIINFIFWREKMLSFRTQTI